jgi:hypothetical protein
MLMDEFSERWNLQGILSGDYSTLLCFLVDLAIMFECNITLPSNVSIAVICTQTVDGAVVSKTNRVQITSEYTQFEKFPSQSFTELSKSYSQDLFAVTGAFEQLIDSAEKLNEICVLMVQFANNHLAELGHKIHSLHELADGKKLVLLIGMVGGFFVPFDRFYLNPNSEEHRDKNMSLALKLMEKPLEIKIELLSKKGFCN